jgi:hypothetical protein
MSGLGFDIAVTTDFLLRVSIQRKQLYLRMSNVLLNNIILAIYGLWKSNEIVLFTSWFEIIKLIKNAVRLILANFGRPIVGFLVI